MRSIFRCALFVSFFQASLAFASSQGYEVWASDQSNSVPNQSSLGVKGSFLWIWDSQDIERQLAGGQSAQPLGCAPGALQGPCDLLDVFPEDLIEVDHLGQPTGMKLGDLNGFGRLHGMIPDPQQRYMNVNIFAPSGGYVGVIDARSKAAIALFRVTATQLGSAGLNRSVHMSFWSADGSAIIVANLNGKVLERIDVTRNPSGKIKSLSFNRSASLGVGKSMTVAQSATAFKGKNSHAQELLGQVVGEYDLAAFGDLTPSGECKENGCVAGPDASLGGRPNNLIICPITSSKGHAYVTFGGGGLLVADITQSPMAIVGEYSNQVVNGAGCGGVEVEGEMWLNAGVSASGAGATQSAFTLYTLDVAGFGSQANAPNQPMPITIEKDLNNTATGGNTEGLASNDTGQLPGVTTRRDSHGMVAVGNHSVHTVDRVQNTVTVSSTSDGSSTIYDLVSQDGQGNGVGPCSLHSVSDDANLPANDPAPDLLDITPDQRYLMIAFRGPAPVSVAHSAQGSCPGVGIVELIDGGTSGRLVGVLRTSNTTDTGPVSAPVGHDYIGAQRSDVHGVSVIKR